MKLAITCIAWVESLIKKEADRLWYEITEVSDRMVEIESDLAWIARFNLWSRVWNKVYLELAKKQVKTFDNLYDAVFFIDWSKYAWKSSRIIVDAVSIKSTLTSIPSIQKISKKSIVSKITWSKDDILYEDPNWAKTEILILIKNDICRILLNTSWEALHKRWYRKSTHEAPIKESLAAALVLLSPWRFKWPLIDPFCWSGTIVIEAALIAKNIAPWSLWRRFTFEDFSWYDRSFLEAAKIEAKSKIFSGWEYKIFGSDIDSETVKDAMQNARNAWVDDCITFTCSDFRDLPKDYYKWVMVSNPPYWLRLQSEDIEMLYANISSLFRANSELSWWVITSFLWLDSMIKLADWNKRKLYNWNELCYFYNKKPK